MKIGSINVGIVGATGAVGQELLQLLHARNCPMASLRLFASARSAGKTVVCAGKTYTVEEAKPGVFAGIDVAFFAAGGLVPAAAGSGGARFAAALRLQAESNSFRCATARR